MQLNKTLSLRRYFGKNYDEFVRLKKLYTIFKTGKSAKKSTEIARYMVLLATLDQRFCGIVLRKVLLDHEKSTFPAIIKAFNRLQEQTGYNWRADWEVYKGAKNPHIINLKTGQIFRFVSYDKPESMAGLELEDERLYYGIIWFEEPMQISDKNENGFIDSQKQKQEKENFDIIRSSAFRGKQLPNQHREIIFSFNDWSDGDYWIIEKYVKKFLQENSEILDKKGKQAYYDPEFENGGGILVVIASGGINEFNDKDYINFITDIKKNDPEFYKAIWLGTAAQVMGNAYSAANIKKINRVVDLSDVDEWLIGLDYSVRKDFIVLSLNARNTKTFRFQTVDAWRYHRGKEVHPMAEPELIKFLWQKIKNWREEFNFSKYEYKTAVHFDNRDATMGAFLHDEWELDTKEAAAIRLDIDEPLPAPKHNNAASFIRIGVMRWLIGSGLYTIAPHLDWLLDEYKARTIKKDGIVDGGDDGVQSVEYSFSFQIEQMIPLQAYNSIVEAYGQFSETKREGWQHGPNDNN